LERTKTDVQDGENVDIKIGEQIPSRYFHKKSDGNGDDIENLLVISPHYLTFVKDYCEALAKYVDEIHVIVYYNPLTNFAKYFQIGYLKHISRFTTIDKLIDKTDLPSNVFVHVIKHPYLVPDSKNMKLGEKLFDRYLLYTKRSNIKFDLIHAHFLWPCGYAAVKLGKTLDVPVIVTGHGYDVYDLPFRDSAWKAKIKWVLDNADLVTTVSQSNKDILVNKLGVPPEKVEVIPNGFNSKLFKPVDKSYARRVLNLPEDRKIILNVANLVPIKGHEYLIRAMNEVVKQRRDVLCIVVGDGPLKKKLIRLTKELNLEKFVRFVGAKPHSEIPLWMNAADIFVLPSLNEGNPTVMFEALGVGLPFVGTRVGGVPEIINSEDYGLLVEPADSYDLAEKILTALDRKWDGVKIRKYAEHYSWENIAKDVVKLYSEISILGVDG